MHFCCIAVILVLVLILLCFRRRCKSKLNSVENFKQVMNGVNSQIGKLESKLVLGEAIPSGTGTCYLDFDPTGTKAFVDSQIIILTDELSNIAFILGTTSADYLASKDKLDSLTASIATSFKPVIIGVRTVFTFNGYYSCSDFCTANNDLSLYKSTFDAGICTCPLDSYPILNTNKTIQCNATSDTLSRFKRVASTIDFNIADRVRSNVTYKCGNVACPANAVVQPARKPFPALTSAMTTAGFTGTGLIGFNAVNSNMTNATNSHILVLETITIRSTPTLTVLSSGNVFVYKGSTVPADIKDKASRIVWSKDGIYTSDPVANSDISLVMQNDGSLVVKSIKANRTYWTATSSGVAGAKAYFENDGSISVVNPNGVIAWNSTALNTGQIMQKSSGRVAQPYSQPTLNSDGSITLVNNTTVTMTSTPDSLLWYTLFFMRGTKNQYGELTGPIVHSSTGKIMHPLGGSETPADGTKVVLSTDEDKPATKFTLTTDGQIKHVTSGFVVMDFPTIGWVLKPSPARTDASFGNNLFSFV